MSMRAWSLFLILIAIAVPASAQAQIGIELNPPTPPEGSDFVVKVSGAWRDSCVPIDPTVFVTGRWIIATFRLGPGGCLAAVTPFEASVTIPGRTRGDYILGIRYVDFDGTVAPLAQTSVRVDTSSMELINTVYPDFGLADWATAVEIRANFACDGCTAPRVWFGEREVDVAEFTGDSVIRTVTPYDAPVDEVVDVVVRRGDREWRRPGGFRFLAQHEFERVMVPISFAGEIPGAHGSVWQSRTVLYNGHAVPLLPGADLLGIDLSCPVTCPGLTLPPGGEIPAHLVARDETVPSAILYVHRTLREQVTVQSRIRDLSRQSTTWGTEVPVVDGREAGRWTDRLLDVPIDDDFRVMLRMYGLYGQGSAIIKIFDAATGQKLIDEAVPLILPAGSLDPWSGFPHQPSYVQIGNLQDRPELSGTDRVRIEMFGTGGPAWILASVTHVETQHVTLVSPQ